VNRLAAVADTAPQEAADRGSSPPGVPCRYLRTNGMYIFDGRPGDTEDDDYEPSSFWCLRTMKAFGPDDDFVGRRECCDSGRACYEPL
jgi:hypothetical protein